MATRWLDSSDWDGPDERKCTKCGVVKSARKDFNWVRSRATGKRHPRGDCAVCQGKVIKAWQARNRDAFHATNRRFREQNPARVMWKGARERARNKCLPFDLEESDIVIPTHCPVLGIELQIGKGQPTDASPTLDRVVPEKGYVKGNVAVISSRANTIKRHGTAAEHEAIARWMRSVGAN